jgi:hypothetical protein
VVHRAVRHSYITGHTSPQQLALSFVRDIKSHHLLLQFPIRAVDECEQTERPIRAPIFVGPPNHNFDALELTCCHFPTVWG